jgi:hypothetical protein
MLKLNYIYLLHTREFINAEKNIYKVGKTCKENLCRFNQYPKGSQLLLQTICSNCNICERKILKIFNKKFIKAKEIGNEYFEGDYLEMIDIINTVVKNEYYNDDEEIEEIEEIKMIKELEDKEEYNIISPEKDNKDGIENEIDIENPYIITTYEEWIKYTNIINIVLINKKGEGYLRFYNQLYIKLKSNKDLNFIEEYDEDLQNFLGYHKNQELYYNKRNNELISYRKYYKVFNEEKNKYKKSDFRIVEYDLDKIYKDCLIKCYKKITEPYKLKYHEYCLSKHHNNGNITEYILYNIKDNTITNIDDYIGDKIITETVSGISGFLNIKNNIDINIIDKIFDNFIDKQTKKEFKIFAYNVIVEPIEIENEIIFYDTNNRILTSIFNGLMHHLSYDNVYITPYKYYYNKSEMKKSIREKRPKYAIVHSYEGKDEKNVLNEFRNLGIRYFIMVDNKKNIYDKEKYKNYMIQNEEKIKEIIKTENGDNYNINTEHKYKRLLNSWKYVIEDHDEIFNRQFALEHNFLKWCCSK